MKGFIEFIREQGVIGLAVGFILGGSVSKVVTSFVNDIINPILGIALGAAGDLDKMYFAVGSAKIMWGSFTNSLIDFLVLAAIVYFGVKRLRLNELDNKEKAKKK